jgi:hypothetical protein
MGAVGAPEVLLLLLMAKDDDESQGDRGFEARD